MGKVSETIVQKLTDALAPVRLEIEDLSARHAGHAAARPEGETHFQVTIVSTAFAGMDRVARQRRVYELLGALINNPVHALALTTRTPEEDEKIRA